MKTFTIAVIAGDGVGIEVIPQAKRVLERIGKKHQVSFAFQDFDWGAEHFFRWGRMMPAGAIDLLQPCDAIPRRSAPAVTAPGRRCHNFRIRRDTFRLSGVSSGPFVMGRKKPSFGGCFPSECPGF
jgi:isocitrate/isopropylmalate dehydrogenase